MLFIHFFDGYFRSKQKSSLIRAANHGMRAPHKISFDDVRVERSIARDLRVLFFYKSDSFEVEWSDDGSLQ